MYQGSSLPSRFQLLLHRTQSHLHYYVLLPSLPYMVQEHTGCADTVNLIGRHGNSKTGSTDCNSEIHFSVCNCFSNLFPIFRIRTALIRISSVIDNFISFFHKILYHLLFSYPLQNGHSQSLFSYLIFLLPFILNAYKKNTGCTI